MEDKTLKKRLTISLDYSLLAKLDNRNRSGDVERILKQHFQREGAEQLYDYIKGRLEKEGLLNTSPSHTSSMINSAPVVRQYAPCCHRYPDLDCGHWYKLPDTDIVKNKRTSEEREIG